MAADPGDSHAWGVLGDAHLEVGRYAEAERAYQRMLETGDDLYAHARSAALPSLRGDVPGAIAALERALARGRAEGRPAEAVAWVEWQLGQEHWSRGDLRGRRDGLPRGPHHGPGLPPGPRGTGPGAGPREAGGRGACRSSSRRSP